jgi:hypothetical protein
MINERNLFFDELAMVGSELKNKKRSSKSVVMTEQNQ